MMLKEGGRLLVVEPKLHVSKKEFDKEIAKREKELKRKTEALAETAALLVLQKKTSDLFRDEE